MKVSLEREEMLSCIIALEKEKKPGEWSKSALRKLLKAMGLRSKNETRPTG
jgi:hypothetical protein